MLHCLTLEGKGSTTVDIQLIIYCSNSLQYREFFRWPLGHKWVQFKPYFHYPSWRPELTGDLFPLPVNTGHVDGRAFPLAELTGRVNYNVLINYPALWFPELKMLVSSPRSDICTNWPRSYLDYLIGWLSGRTSVSDWRTFTVLHRTCSWWVTIYMGKPSTRPTQPFILTGSINE